MTYRRTPQSDPHPDPPLSATYAIILIWKRSPYFVFHLPFWDFAIYLMSLHLIIVRAPRLNNILRFITSAAILLLLCGCPACWNWIVLKAKSNCLRFYYRSSTTHVHHERSLLSGLSGWLQPLAVRRSGPWMWHCILLTHPPIEQRQEQTTIQPRKRKTWWTSGFVPV